MKYKKIILGISILFLFLFTVSSVLATDQIFTAVGDNGQIAWSDDGKTWTDSGTVVSNYLDSVTYSSELDLFVAVGESGQTAWSDDGKTWTDSGTIGSNNLKGVAWEKNLTTQNKNKLETTSTLRQTNLETITDTDYNKVLSVVINN